MGLQPLRGAQPPALRMLGVSVSCCHRNQLPGSSGLKQHLYPLHAALEVGSPKSVSWGYTQGWFPPEAPGEN